jgi:hypothetical protein
MSDTTNSNTQLNAGTPPAQPALQDAIARSKNLSGHANDQNTLSFCRGAETSVSVSVKPVDRKTIEGSTPGDFRAKSADAVLPANPAPRAGMTQAPLGSKSPSNLPGTVANWGGSADSDAGN